MRIPAFVPAVLGALALGTPLSGQTWTWTGPGLPIPDTTSPGVCTSPATASIDVPAGATVTDVNIALDLSHPYCGDLRIRLFHDGVWVTIADTIPFDASPFGSTYIIDDEAPMTLDAAMLGAPGAAPVPGGTYRGDGLLSAFDGHPRGGPWMIEFCDLATGFSGFMGGFMVNISSVGAGGLTYVVDQFVIGGTAGLTRIRMTVTGGVLAVPTNFCLKAWTTNLGNYPNGWFFGVDMSFNELFIFVGLGWPFYHIFGITGEAYSYFDGVPVGLGVTIYGVAVELDAVTSFPVHWSAPTALTLM